MKRCAKFLFIASACCIATSACAATAPVLSEQVIAMQTDGSIQLEHAGKARFANIRFPEAKLAETWLAGHVLQQALTFEAGDTDRYGRMLITSDTEEKMLREGIAIIYASEGNIPASWPASEAVAHGKKLGGWANADLVVTPLNAAQHENEFHVVEGTLMHIYEGKTATYLNFGADWHSDFSITIPAKLRRNMTQKLATIKEGDHVRVRGRLYEENGPMIMLTNADNLERY